MSHAGVATDSSERISMLNSATSIPEGATVTVSTPSSTSPRGEALVGTDAPDRTSSVEGSLGMLVAAVVGKPADAASQDTPDAMAAPATTLREMERRYWPRAGATRTGNRSVPPGTVGGKGRPTGAPRSASMGAAAKLACTTTSAPTPAPHRTAARSATSAIEFWLSCSVPSDFTTTAEASEEEKTSSADGSAHIDHRRPDAHSAVRSVE
mmetsp:Transcript_25123/g.81265  ORF Transcript_25123/g.81265 Transcript_25123/m.81265 type:complete len:210 (+) Transcript_25123:1651-2280(+)